jgi:hypothetical protein
MFLMVYTRCPLLNLYKSENLNSSENVISSENLNSSENLILSENSTFNNNSILNENSTFNENLIPSENSTFNENLISSENSTFNENSILNGKATFYFRINDDIDGCPDVQTFNDNNTYGPCGAQYNSNSKYWCAIKNAKDYCGKSLTVYYKENSIDLIVMDECPSCDNKVDMSLEALIELTGSKENACAINQELPDIKWNLLL